MRRRHVHLSFAVAALGALLARPARADDKAACIDAHEQAQLLRHGGELRKARRRLLDCVEACPPRVQSECAAWLEEVEASQPTVVFAVRDALGREARAVRVRVDGQLLVERLDGRAVRVDPGERTFVFETAGAPAVVRRVVVRQGEKNRLIEARFGGEPDSRANEESPARGAGDSLGVAALVVGGVGLAAMASFAGFAVSGRNRQDELERCAPRCAPEEADAMYRLYVAADVSLGVGTAALITATVLAVWHYASGDSDVSRTGLVGHF